MLARKQELGRQLQQAQKQLAAIPAGLALAVPLAKAGGGAAGQAASRTQQVRALWCLRLALMSRSPLTPRWVRVAVAMACCTESGERTRHPRSALWVRLRRHSRRGCGCGSRSWSSSCRRNVRHAARRRLRCAAAGQGWAYCGWVGRLRGRAANGRALAGHCAVPGRGLRRRAQAQPGPGGTNAAQTRRHTSPWLRPWGCTHPWPVALAPAGGPAGQGVPDVGRPDQRSCPSGARSARCGRHRSRGRFCFCRRGLGGAAGEQPPWEQLQQLGGGQLPSSRARTRRATAQRHSCQQRERLAGRAAAGAEPGPGGERGERACRQPSRLPRGAGGAAQQPSQ